MKNLLKKFTHKFIVDDKGAVSIYLIIITLLLFLFNAVLIDFARIIVAERQTEEAAKTALRSTMSSYHNSLQDKGLFGFDGDQSKADAIFKEVFAENLKSGDDNAFHLIGLSPVDGEITTTLDRNLASEEILTYQILEEMKYKAPVEVGEALIKSFLSISSVVEQASDFSNVAKEVNGKAKDREEKLDEALEYLEKAKKILQDIDPIINGRANSTYPKVNNIEDIMTKKGTYRKYYTNKDNDDEELDEEELEAKEKEKENAELFQENARKLIEDLITEVIAADVELLLALTVIKEAEELNNEVKETINNMSSNGDYDDAKSISDQAGEGDSDSLMGALEDYILDEELFTELIEAVEAAIDKLDRNSIRTDTLLPKLEKDFLEEIDNHFAANFTKRVNNVRTYHEVILGHIERAINILKEKRAEYKENKEEMEEEETKGDEALEDNKDMFEDIEEAINAGKSASNDHQKYTDLSTKAAKYGAAIAENTLKFEMTDKDDTADEAMSFLDTLFKEIGSLLLSGRDKVYVNEYILLRFKSHDFSESGVGANNFENNQVEYIIYGLTSHGANYFAALSEIFAVRFGINLAAAFLKPEGKVFGPFLWVYALADALASTIGDMERLTNGKTIDLFPSVKGMKFKPMPTMSYKDHLRLFLFVHAKGKRFERLMAVLDDGTGADLTEKSTYISGNATSTIKLWFLPQVADMLSKTNVISGRVEGNKYFIEKEVHFSY